MQANSYHIITYTLRSTINTTITPMLCTRLITQPESHRSVEIIPASSENPTYRDKDDVEQTSCYECYLGSLLQSPDFSLRELWQWK